MAAVKTQKLIAAMGIAFLLLSQIIIAEEGQRYFRSHQVYDLEQKVIFSSDFGSDEPFHLFSISEDDRYRQPKANPKRLEVVDSPTRGVRFSVPRAPNSFRSELSLPSEKGFQERWYAERMRIPKDWEIDENRAADIVMQWHAIPGNWRATYPNASIAIQGKHWWVRRNFGNAQEGATRKKTQLATPLQPGAAVDWLVYAKWAPDESGLFRVWMNGELVFEEKGINVYNTIGIEYTPYLKTGIYRPEWYLRDERRTQQFAEERNPVSKKEIFVEFVRVGRGDARPKDLGYRMKK